MGSHKLMNTSSIKNKQICNEIVYFNSTDISNLISLSNVRRSTRLIERLKSTNELVCWDQNTSELNHRNLVDVITDLNNLRSKIEIKCTEHFFDLDDESNRTNYQAKSKKCKNNILFNQKVKPV